MMKHFYCLCLWSMWLLLTTPTIIAQNSCTNNRYIDDNFEVELVNELNFGTAPNSTVNLAPAFYSQTNTSDQQLDMDIYLPQGDTLTKRPLIVMAFGGAFITGWKEYPALQSVCEAWARKGFVVASIDYRLGFTITPNGQEQAVRAVYRGIQDFAAAVRYLKANAATYNIDTNIIIGGGHSAGGFSALHDAFLVEADRAASPLTASTYEFQASNGSVWPDLDCPECGGNNLNAAPHHLNGKIDIVVNLWGAIADTSWLDAGEPPVISFHGNADNVVPIDYGPPFGEAIGGIFFPSTYGSVPIHERLNNIGTYNEIHIFEGAGHEPWALGNPTHQYIIDSTVAFLVDVMKPEEPVITGLAAIPAGSTTTYSVPTVVGATYCWEVINGTIIANNGSEIIIQWDANMTTGLIEVRTINLNVVESDQAIFTVTATPPLRAFAKVFLEGAYIGGATPLSHHLTVTNTIPLTQSYSGAPWNYNGIETVNNLPNNAVDWVLFELRDPNNLNVVIEQKAALLLNDGTLQDVDGFAGVTFNTFSNNSSADYQIVIRHRNHLDILSTEAITLPNTVATLYDFSSSMHQALGTDQMIEVDTGIYAMCAGDMNGTGIINVKDFNQYFIEIGNSGYLQSDCNFDQNNTITDFNLYRINSSLIGVNYIRY